MFRPRIRTAVYAFALLLIAACSGKPYIVLPEPQVAAMRARTVYVVSHGWHAGLVVPAREINQVMPEFAARFGDVDFYEFGWGDKGFYQAEKITVGLILQAMLWSEGTVMHVVAVPASPTSYFAGKEIIDTCVTEAELRSLIAYVASSFARDQAGKVVPLKLGIYGDSQFYDAEGEYYLLNTCNKWTAKALQSAGFDILPTFKLNSGSVMNYLRARRNTCANLPTAAYSR